MATMSLCSKCQRPLAARSDRMVCSVCLVEAALRDRTAHAALLEPGAGEPLSAPGLRVGDYELLEEIARGAMGVVYRARQVSANRVVAVKMILAGHFASEWELRRFRSEAESAAALAHPNIVPIHEVGEHEGRPFFSMRFMEGGSLSARAADPQFQISNREAAKLLARVARAVHYAHQRGILHRDLKPANILLDEQGEPHVTDFGLAKRLDGKPSTHSAQFTLSGSILGTPEYMAPEQATGSSKETTTAADVFSLGAILYELLAGQPPFHAATPLETMRRVAEEDPLPLSRVAKRADHDLETICLKCLQKEPAKRYSSAAALAEDLERWLRNEPIHARPSSTWEQGVKWVKRNPARGALLALMLIAPAVVIAVLLVMGDRVRRERNLALQHEERAKAAAARAESKAEEANAARAQTRQNLYAADMLLAQQALDEGNLGVARRLIEAHRPPKAEDIGPLPGGTSRSAIDRQIGDDLRGFEWRYLWKASQGGQLHTLHGHSNAVHAVVFSRDGQMLASGDEKGAVKVWHFDSRRPIATFSASQNRIVRLSFSADGNALATADKTGAVAIWELKTGKELWSHQGRNPAGGQLSPQGALIGVTKGTLTGKETDGVAQVIEWPSGKEVLQVGPSADFEAFSNDGKLAFITRGGGRRLTELWELQTGRLVKTISGFNGELLPSPDGKSFVTVWPERGGIFLIELDNADRPTLLKLSGTFGFLRMAFAPDGTVLASAGPGQTVRLWDVATRRELGPMLGHVNEVTDIAFSPDGRFLATSSADHTVKLWPSAPRKQSEVISNAWAPYVMVDGQKFVCFDDHKADTKKLVIRNLATHQSTLVSTEPLVPERFADGDQTLLARGEVTSSGYLPVLRWDLNNPGSPPKTTLLNLQRTNAIGSCAIAPNGKICAVSQQRISEISLWNPVSGECAGRVRQPAIGAPAKFSPDSRKLVSIAGGNVARGNQLNIIDLEAQDNPTFIRLDTEIQNVAFSPDGKVICAGCVDHTIRLFDSTTLKELAVLPGHQSPVMSVGFSPGGRTLASCAGGTVKLWSWPAQREVATIIQSTTAFRHIDFTSDGSTLFAGDWAGLVHVWRAPRLSEIDDGGAGAR